MFQSLLSSVFSFTSVCFHLRLLSFPATHASFTSTGSMTWYNLFHPIGEEPPTLFDHDAGISATHAKTTEAVIVTI